MKNKHDAKIVMVILAAGESARMGKNIKQLLPWKDTTLLGHTIEQGLASDVDLVFIVLGANYKTIADSVVHHNITIIKNKNWSSGMGSSIACAMDFFKKNNIYFDAILFALSDQPFIEFIHFNKLIYSFLNKNKNIVSSQLMSRVGVPAILGFNYFKALSKLKNDVGAREIIAKNINDVYIVKTEDLNIDIDTEESYKALYNKYGKLNKPI